MHYLYILKSHTSGNYYTGSSVDPENRLGYHNTVEKGYTSRYRPWELVFTKGYKTKEEAQRAERKVKSWKSRKMIEKLIRGEIEI